LTAEQVAALYDYRGWQIRKTGWTEYEMRSEWADLALYPDHTGALLLHGLLVGPLAREAELFAPLREAGVRCWGELYGADDELLQEFKW
jgi:hypothetical protein